ncbi:MAG TPA: polymer-forming cytoskeletal protein [Stellaceae bacterium]|nr:polymer-forming cytoskeletal protein [Stellaceae bacterium]
MTGDDMAIFNRSKRAGDEEEGEIATQDQDSDLDLPVKPAARPSPGSMVPARYNTVMPPAPSETRAIESRGIAPRSGDIKTMEGRPVAEMTRPSDMARRLVEAPPPAKLDSELRKLTVGREISLQGEITHCDQLVVEGSVTANLSCQEVAIMESGVLKGAVDIGHIEVRGLFEGTLNVSGRLLIRSTGRVVGKVHYGQIEIEIGGQISGEVEAQTPTKSLMKNGSGASVTAGVI